MKRLKVGDYVREVDGKPIGIITVMFSDLVGSTALSARMDPVILALAKRRANRIGASRLPAFAAA